MILSNCRKWDITSKKSLHGSAAASQSGEKDPVKGDVTAPHSTSPPRILCSYQQNIADYICLFMEEGEELTLGEDWAVPLIVEVSLSILFLSSIPLSIYCITSGQCLTQSNLHFQDWQKICLADHIKKMANQLHADAIQQIEVALLVHQLLKSWTSSQQVYLNQPLWLQLNCILTPSLPLLQCLLHGK